MSTPYGIPYDIVAAARAIAPRLPSPAVPRLLILQKLPVLEHNIESACDVAQNAAARAARAAAFTMLAQDAWNHGPGGPGAFIILDLHWDFAVEWPDYEAAFAAIDSLDDAEKSRRFDALVNDSTQ